MPDLTSPAPVPNANLPNRWLLGEPSGADALPKPITTLATRVVRGDGVVAIEGTAVWWTMEVG